VLPSIINAALLTSAWSAGCADLFVSSRALYGLCVRGQAPQFLAKKTRKDGLPWLCVLVCAAFSLLSFMAADQHSEAGTVFGYCRSRIPDLSAGCLSLSISCQHDAMCGMISWTGILWTSIRWNEVEGQGIDASLCPIRAPFQPYLSYC